MKKKLEKNVTDFIDKCAEEVGKFKADDFNQELFYSCIEENMESPIEHLLYCALRTVMFLNCIENAEPVEIDGKFYIIGLEVSPQVKIQNYRCDFQVTFSTPIKPDGSQRINKSVIVECDSQEFHERNEQERRYEKQRDRYLVSQGYKIFHYTGSEIVKNPLIVAAEIISYLTEQPRDTLSLDSNME